jgi:two-component system sensor histidine kinase/response regulator
MTARSLDLHGIKTLVIEPEASVRTALKKTLADWGAEVSEADVAARGIAELTRARDAGRPFALIFVASAMTAMDGFGVADVLRAHPAELARTILMLGGDHMVDEVGRAQKLAVGAYVAKPLSRSVIVGAIASVLGVEVSTDASMPPHRLRRARILLAEDSSEIAWILRTEIEGTDYQVDVARDGFAAVDLFRLGEYDLVLMDIQMPGCDGYAATREIRAWEHDHGSKRTPIVAVTAFAHDEDPQKSLRAGLDGYFVKPIDREKLLSVIGRYLKHK